MLVEIETFVNWVRRRNPQARTWRDYRYDLVQFLAIVGDKAPDAVTIHDIDRFVVQQADRGLKPSTINRRLAAITSLYIYLSDDAPDLTCPVLPHRHTLRQPQHLPRPGPRPDHHLFFGPPSSPIQFPLQPLVQVFGLYRDGRFSRDSPISVFSSFPPPLVHRIPV